MTVVFITPCNVKVRLYNNESLSFKSNTGDGKKIMVENLENISKKFCRRWAPNIYMNLHPKSMVWLYRGLGCDITRFPQKCLGEMYPLHQEAGYRAFIRELRGNAAWDCKQSANLSSTIWWIQSHHSIISAHLLPCSSRKYFRKLPNYSYCVI